MDENAETPHETQQTAHGQGEALPGGIGQPIVQQQSRNTEERGYFRKGESWVSLLTLLFVGAYTVLTVFILCNAQEQAQISRLNFRMDQRPYIFVENIPDQPPRFKQAEKARWDVHYVNFGKSPSINEATDAHVWVGKAAYDKAQEFLKGLPFKKPENMASFITPPNATASRGQPGFKFITLFSDSAITDDEFAFINATDGGVVLAGRVWYYDVFGDRHSTDFCRYSLVTGAISDCPRYNEIR
jgi:hypothetical protein